MLSKQTSNNYLLSNPGNIYYLLTQQADIYYMLRNPANIYYMLNKQAFELFVGQASQQNIRAFQPCVEPGNCTTKFLKLKFISIKT